MEFFKNYSTYSNYTKNNTSNFNNNLIQALQKESTHINIENKLELSDNLTSIYPEYFLSLITINIFIYTILLYNLFSVMMLFDLKYIKTLTDLKIYGYTEVILMLIILLFLSLAGIPPLFGFTGKFLMFFLYAAKTHPFILSFFIIFNLFALYFYFQNVRFLNAKNPATYYNVKNMYVMWDKVLIKVIISLNIVNLGGFLFLSDILIFFANIYCYSL